MVSFFVLILIIAHFIVSFLVAMIMAVNLIVIMDQMIFFVRIVLMIMVMAHDVFNYLKILNYKKIME